MDLFDEIHKVKQDFPKKKVITDELNKQSFNFYQGCAITLFIVLFLIFHLKSFIYNEYVALNSSDDADTWYLA